MRDDGFDFSIGSIVRLVENVCGARGGILGRHDALCM